MKLVKTPTKQPYHIDYSLVKSLYKITTESIKLVLDVEQFDVSSNCDWASKNGPSWHKLRIII